MEQKNFSTFRWLPIIPPEGSLGEFISSLGPGQVVGRQVLASPCLGEIQMNISVKGGDLEVKVIRARNLVKKPGAKYNPGTSVCQFCIYNSILFNLDKSY